MRIVYSPRAIRDLEDIASYYCSVADLEVAAAVSDRFEQVINRIARQPQSAPRVVERPGVRAVLVLNFPYKIFYRVREDAVEILHIRHTARQPWTADED